MRESGRGEYVDLLVWAAYGERKGEALFAAMAERTADPREKVALELLASLERAMVRRLQPLVAAEGGGDELTADQELAIKALASDLAGDWASFLASFADQTTRALERYARLRELAPRPAPPELSLLTAHEEALVEFARLELDGDREAASAAVRAVVAAVEDE